MPGATITDGREITVGRTTVVEPAARPAEYPLEYPELRIELRPELALPPPRPPLLPATISVDPPKSG
eukprot:CAMPEP_0195508950 /NCGR_PEP_ID=MMETSP0794_2-20130614/2027_1 /TAXON_ID=515487 /ORGANISM="Stephanopyxis turris, Strain CCMP 815" /LENGTH=66 /DNA_ID=CAMNT_0040636053 /DNA_START=707 /DNA_END=904 /DNA_ORIENTATION=-